MPGSRPQAHRPGRPPTSPDQGGQDRAQQPGLFCLSVCPLGGPCVARKPLSLTAVFPGPGTVLGSLQAPWGWWALWNGISNWPRARGSEDIGICLLVRSPV